MSLVNTILKGRYRILKELATGGMGAVYEAEDLTFNIKVAVKEHRLQGSESLDDASRDYYRAAFEREARLLANLRHDSLPRVIDRFSVDNDQFLVMEFIDGDDLMKALEKNGRAFPLEKVLAWADQLLEVLEYLHKREPPVIHRDIKPHNLKLSREGKIILIDFGLARGSAKGITHLPDNKSIYGYTPNFASIEQILRDNSLQRETSKLLLNPEKIDSWTKKETDAASDLYSAGATLYCLMTGYLPVDATKRMVETARHNSDPLLPVDKLDPAIPPHIAAALQKATALDRAERFASAAEMRAALKLVSPPVPALQTGETLIMGSAPLVWPPKPKLDLRPFEFDIITVDATGNLLEKTEGRALFFAEDLHGTKLSMVEIPSGRFLMGARKSEAGSHDWERPQHNVTLSSFFMSISPVTQAQWRAVAELPKVHVDLPGDPAHFKGDKRPVESVSWEEAVEFCARLSLKTAGTYRLPTEAEWEYACRAGTTTPFHFAETLVPGLANYDGNQPYGKFSKSKYRAETTESTGFKALNRFGLCCMHGNVWEWCLDWYGEYPDADVGDPQGPSTGAFHVIRGGAWDSGASFCRSAQRGASLPASRSHNLGFRVVRAAL